MAKKKTSASAPKKKSFVPNGYIPPSKRPKKESVTSSAKSNKIDRVEKFALVEHHYFKDKDGKTVRRIVPVNRSPVQYKDKIFTDGSKKRVRVK